MGWSLCANAVTQMRIRFSLLSPLAFFGVSFLKSEDPCE